MSYAVRRRLGYPRNNAMIEVEDFTAIHGTLVAHHTIGYKRVEDEGVWWIRGHHEEGSDAVKAARVAQALWEDR